MQQILGILRLAVALVVLIVGALLVLLACLWPWRVQKCRPAAWVTVWLARGFCRLFNLRVHCAEPAKLRQHRGLIFPNHLSYLDIIVLLSITPVRFLSMAAVRDYPLIGWIAHAIGTVFVVREDENSRQQARTAIVQSLASEPEPPLVLFPEGKIGQGAELLPFRHGAFEIAIEHGIAFLPCGLRYTPLRIAAWHNGHLLTPLWQLAQFPGPLQVEVLPLTGMKPPVNADPGQMAEAIRQAMAQALHLR
ncbi:MAG: 1-acyl-sn-glycerol-3-phosphate acyltransferase [Caldilineaceae bacterium]